MIEAMIDLETLGTDQDAAVVQIAAVAFCGARVLGTCDVRVPLSAPDQGRIDPNTLAWWMGQPDAVFRSVVQREGENRLADAIVHLVGFLETQRVERTWSCGPTFDHAILRHHAGRLRVCLPASMSFRNERCFRTARDLASRLGISSKKKPTHDALQDCLDQHDALVSLLQEVGILGQEQTK